jgi:hypothetical protein
MLKLHPSEDEEAVELVGVKVGRRSRHSVSSVQLDARARYSVLQVSPVARSLRAILIAGLLARTLDIVAAFSVYGLQGADPVIIRKSIVSGHLGPVAFGGALHFFIALVAAAVYYAASRMLPLLVRRPSPRDFTTASRCTSMNPVVLPLSAVTKRRFDPGLAVVPVGVHMLCVGFAIALPVRRHGG